MPWNPVTFAAVCAGLRRSAAAGEFTPYQWVDDIEMNEDGGRTFYGCGWGVIGWVTAVMMGGTAWAEGMLPIGCNQKAINTVLMLDGLSKREIRRMTPGAAWRHFDEELAEAYDNRAVDPDTFIAKSEELAEFFIDVLSRVRMKGTIHQPPSAEVVWKQPTFFSLFKALPKKALLQVA